ncbi:hypothetical protein LINGRAHAP2_LOCUS28248 [Linum grandiflorum]
MCGSTTFTGRVICLADYLAGRGRSLPLRTHNIVVSDPVVASWIAYDHLRSSQSQ